MSFIVWLVAVAVTLLVVYAASLATITALFVCGVMLVWAAIIWGGLIILDDDGFF